MDFSIDIWSPLFTYIGIISVVLGLAATALFIFDGLLGHCRHNPSDKDSKRDGVTPHDDENRRA